MNVFFVNMVTLTAVAVVPTQQSLTIVGDTEDHKHGVFGNNGRKLKQQVYLLSSILPF
jgi:hypothetical protein